MPRIAIKDVALQGMRKHVPNEQRSSDRCWTVRGTAHRVYVTFYCIYATPFLNNLLMIAMERNVVATNYIICRYNSFCTQGSNNNDDSRSVRPKNSTHTHTHRANRIYIDYKCTVPTSYHYNTLFLLDTKFPCTYATPNELRWHVIFGVSAIHNCASRNSLQGKFNFGSYIRFRMASIRRALQV